MKRALLFVLLAFSLTGCAVRARYYDRDWDHDRYYHHYDRHYDRDDRGHDHGDRWR